MVTRVCGPGGIWSEPNFSGCTLTSGDPQQFVIFSLYYEFNFGSLDDLMDGDEEQIQHYIVYTEINNKHNIQNVFTGIDIQTKNVCFDSWGGARWIKEFYGLPHPQVPHAVKPNTTCTC